MPIYKCLVTKAWKEAGEADVIVMRRHVNGNVTAGFYLIDLMCLGIKDTFYSFNEPEGDIYDRFPVEVDVMFDEVEYALAHNIIYAGHDFALEFGIEPSKEFAVTKFILEGDNDKIPLIDVPVGDEGGLFHLIVHQPGEYSGVLAKLIKNAGEGNYRYTVTGISEENFNEDDYDYESGDLLENYESGLLTPLNVQYISDAELNDHTKTDQRTPHERLTIATERALRRLRNVKPAYFSYEEVEDDEYDLLDESVSTAYGVTEEDEENFGKVIQTSLSEVAGDEEQEAIFQDLLEKQADKLLIVASIFEDQFSRNGSLLDLAKSRLEDLKAYPLARLDLALANLLIPEPSSDFDDVYNEKDIRAVFAETESFGDKGLATFWLIKMVQNLRNDQLGEAIRYYYLFSEAESLNFISSFVQLMLISSIEQVLMHDKEANSEE